MQIQDIVNVTIGLSATPASQAKFTVPCLLVDDTNVPVDRRYRTVTRSSYATTLTSATAAYNWCAALWGQNYNPATAYIGRWVSAATAPYCTFPNASSTYTVYTGVGSAGKFKMVSGTLDEDIAPDFTGDTNMTEAAASINTALGASANFSTYTCALDALSRITITGPSTGASAAAFEIQSPGSGTDLTGSTYLGTELYQAGLDAEAQETALAAILAKDNTPFIICQSGGSDSQINALSVYVNSIKKILLAVQYSTNAKSGVYTTDFGYTTNALSHKQTFAMYTEHSTANGAAATQYPDAAICGEIMPRTEASTNFALTPLSGVSQSGLDGDLTTVIPLTSDERTALEAKGYDYLVAPSTSTHFVKGLAVDASTEMRIIIGKMYMEAKIAEDVYGYLVARNVVTFSDQDIQAIKAIIVFWAEEMVDRKVLESGYTITMPSAADFTAAQKATHTMTLSNLSDMETQRSANDVTITLTWSV